MKRIILSIVCMVMAFGFFACNSTLAPPQILSIEKVGSSGSTDKYEIKYSDGKSFFFDVTNGSDGKSAFDIAVENGFIGNETEWLESLKGDSGKEGQPGKDAPVITKIEMTGQTLDAYVYTVTLSDGKEYDFEIPRAYEENNDMNMIEVNKLNETANYSPVAAGNRALENAVTVTGPNVKGAHDAQFVIADDKAYIVYEANDVQAGENSSWDYIYCAMTIVDIQTNKVEKIVKFSKSLQQYDNDTLPKGCTFVPRIVKKDDATMRVYFSSEDPGNRESHTYYIDYDIASGKFDNNIYKLQLMTPQGKVDFTPTEYVKLTQAAGNACYPESHSAYLFDIFDYDGVKYITLNNFANGQNALAKFNDSLDCVEVIGHIGEGTTAIKTTESAIMCKNDGTWMSILRDERSDSYMFSYSDDGVKWSQPAVGDVAFTGSATKPTLDNFYGQYFMSWADNSRSCMRFMTSSDAEQWSDVVTVYSPTTFQYPMFELYNNEIYYTATMGNKETIVFGKLPLKYDNGWYVRQLPPTDAENVFANITGYNRYSDITTNRDGTKYEAYIKRDDKGIYFKARTDVSNKGDKIFLMLDTDGTATGFTPSNFMFKFQNGDIQYQGYYKANTRGYVNIAAYSQLLFTRKTYPSSAQNKGVNEISLFIPYSALTILSPDAKVDADADIYFTIYGANGSFESDSSYEGHNTVWNRPSTYLVLTKDNEIKIR